LPIQEGQNPYLNPQNQPNQEEAKKQHKKVEHAFSHTITYSIKDPQYPLPDVIFIANGGVVLPRLPIPTILLPNMKYEQRKEELPYLTKIYQDLGLAMIPFAGEMPFEGQAEIKWFDKGSKAICGYGHRSTKETFVVLQKQLNKIYKKYHLIPPELIPIHLISTDYYHLDIAMLEFDDRKCIVHRRAISKESLLVLQSVLGKENVMVLDTDDKFCLNGVVDGDRLITHQLTPALKRELETMTGKKVHMVNTSEFEKAGGSVRCLTLDLPR
jgi:N-dimethylarginine dimethylaminohydrolase